MKTFPFDFPLDDEPSGPEELTPGQLRDLEEHRQALKVFGGFMPEGSASFTGFHRIGFKAPREPAKQSRHAYRASSLPSRTKRSAK